MYFTYSIVTMRVAKDAVDTDILVNNGDSFAFNSEYLNESSLSQVRFFTCLWMRSWVNLAP